MFGRDGHPTPLEQAFIEYGRIAKTLHLLALVDPIDGTAALPGPLSREGGCRAVQDRSHR